MRFPHLRIASFVCCLCGLAVATGHAQTLRDATPVANGEVRAMARSGNTLYLGGTFTSLGPRTGSATLFDATSGAVLVDFPKVEGVVSAVVSDGAGGWFIGGDFKSVGGLPRSSLAHVRADLTVSEWNPGARGG